MNVVCPLCTYPLDPREDHVIWPLARVHIACQEQSPLSPEEWAARVPCNCSARNVLQTLGGHIVEASKNVPSDQIWISMPESGQIHRFQLFDEQGYLAFKPLPMIPPRPKGQDHAAGQSPPDPS